MPLNLSTLIVTVHEVRPSMSSLSACFSYTLHCFLCLSSFQRLFVLLIFHDESQEPCSLSLSSTLHFFVLILLLNFQSWACKIILMQMIALSYTNSSKDTFSMQMCRQEWIPANRNPAHFSSPSINIIFITIIIVITRIFSPHHWSVYSLSFTLLLASLFIHKPIRKVMKERNLSI